MVRGAVDTWSLGCHMVEMITGPLLFESLFGNPEKELLAILGVPDDEAWPTDGDEQSFDASRKRRDDGDRLFSGATDLLPTVRIQPRRGHLRTGCPG
jgi:hypothetical protein